MRWSVEGRNYSVVLDTLIIILKFVSNNLQYVICLNGIWLLVVVFLYFIINRSQFKWKAIVNRVFMSIVIAGELLLLFLFGYIYLDNIRQGDCVRILPDTTWAKSKFPIYFITGKDLAEVNLDGSNFKYILEAADPIREYHFSPDGKHIVAVTDHEIFLLEKNGKPPQLVDSLGDFVRNNNGQGIINGVKWSPDSRKFCYAIYRWSQYASKDNYYIFDLNKQEKMQIENPMHKIDEFFWDKYGDCLYYSRYSIKNLKALDPYEIQIYRIPLATLKSRPVVSFRSPTFKVPSMFLGSQGIELYEPHSRLSFSRTFLDEPIAISDKGTKAVFEKNYSLYYVKNNNLKTKLYRFPKNKKASKIPILEMAWVPGAQFLVLIHEKEGVLVVKPAAAKMGRIFDYSADALGWYSGSH